jgi:hypothetical protein
MQRLDLTFKPVLCLLVLCSILPACMTPDLGGVNVKAFEGRQKREKRKTPSPEADELAQLREQYVSATKEYKSSLEKLLAIYQGNVQKAEDKLALSRKLFAEGLVAKQQIEENERALASEREKVAETQGQISSADSQIANVLVEAQADQQIAKSLRVARNGLVRTTSFTRYNGVGGWGLNDAWKIEQFFSNTFHRPLPIAVFGQGSIHDRWRLDHHNAMDISLHPDGVEGQALLGFLEKNGIPFSAFREAIPGTATGPHIHIGRPSHRY